MALQIVILTKVIKHRLYSRIEHRFVVPWVLLLMLSIVNTGVLNAQRSERTIFQFQHTGWEAKDGAPSPLFAFAQTTDGVLWMAAYDGLYRFDGIRFEPYVLPAALTTYVGDARALLATPDGGLWIGLNWGGAIFLKDGHTIGYDRNKILPIGGILQFALDHDGKLWAATTGGLARFDGSRWHHVGDKCGFTGRSAESLLVDRAGTLWVASADTLFYLPRGVKEFLIYKDHLGHIGSMGQTPDGTLWAAEDEDSAGMIKAPVIQPLPENAGTRDIKIPKVFLIAGVVGVLVDRSGGLWMEAADKGGLFRVRDPKPLETNSSSSFEGPSFENFNAKNGLTADDMTSADMEDRDGNVWFSTNFGVDRFREANVVPIINYGGTTPLVKGSNGDVWSFRDSSPIHYLLRLHGLKVTRQPLNEYPSAADRDADGSLWMGGYGEISSYSNGRLVKYPFPKGIPPNDVQSVVLDHAGALWVAIVQGRVFRFKRGDWVLLGNEKLPRESAMFIFADSLGRIWFGYPGGENEKDSFPRVAALDGDRVQTFFVADGPRITNVQVMAEGAGRLWFGGERGLALFRNNHFQTLLAEESDALQGINGIVQTANGDLWLNDDPGIARIAAAEVERAIADPTHRMHCEVFDAMDGITGKGMKFRPVPTLVESTDGRLWFLKTGGIFQIDPNHVHRDMTPPTVLIRSVDSGKQVHGLESGIRFAAGTTGVQIRYTAPNLSAPERVRFRYKLIGADHDWQDAGARRQAFYTNLSPKHYRFQVTARNGEGSWNAVGASVEFTIEPTWYQTDWFLNLCIVIAVASVWSLYRIRIWQVERAITARFDERLSERTRMARELHDTFLQTIQGSKFVVDDGLEEPLDAEKMYRALGQVSGWLNQAITEGRAALNSLRSSTILKNELGPALRRAAESGVVPDGMTISVLVIGDARELHPIVRDELYRIGHEAILNAKNHSHASSLAIDLTYGSDLVMHISDNGVGIDPGYAASGREGHHGLQGMRERAARIKAKLTIRSSSDSGTDISVVVPSSVSFLHARSGISAKLRQISRRFINDHEAL